jgi:hypothetical protein
VDRRKLQKIAKRIDVPLNFREFTTLNAYLESQGRGIAAVSSPPGVIREITDHGHVTITLGAQPLEPLRRIDVSRWDLRSQSEILRAMNATGRTVNLAVEDVICRDRAAEDFSNDDDVPQNEVWHKHLKDDGPSVICIGSPKACHASEVMLARMTRLQMFQREPTTPAPPFFFAWPDHDPRAQKVASTFKRTSRQLKQCVDHTGALVTDLADEKCQTSALFDGQLRPVFRGGKEWRTHAVVAAQRRPGNQIWLVLAGLTGPATLGAAMAIHEFAADLSIESGSKCSKLAWATVTSHVKDAGPGGIRWDERRVCGRPVLSSLRQWPE